MIVHAALSVVQEWAATEPLYWACFRGRRPALAALFRGWGIVTRVLPPSLMNSDSDSDNHTRTFGLDLGNHAHPMFSRILCLIMAQEWNSDSDDEPDNPDDLVEDEPVAFVSEFEEAD